MEPEHRLYLYGGSTFILVPESAWLDAIKSDRTGVVVRKSVEDTFLSKGWVKVSEVFDPDTHESTIEWVYEETGAKVKTVVDKEGQLKVNGKAIGSATVGESFKVLKKMAEEMCTKQTWVNPNSEVHAKVKEAKDKATAKPEEKGGPSPMADIMSASKAIADMQIIGKYEPLIVKENLSPPERMKKIHLLMAMAEKEENEQEKQRLMEQVDRELDLAENAANSGTQTVAVGLRDRTGDDTI